MQICTRLQWRNTKVKSDGSGSKSLTPCSSCVVVAVLLSKALKDAHGALKGTSKLHVRAARFYWRLHVGKWNTHSKCMYQCAYTCCIAFAYCDWTMYSTVRYSYKCSLQNTFQVLNTSIVICNTGPYYTSRHQGWSKLHTAFTKLTSKFPYPRQSAKIWR